MIYSIRFGTELIGSSDFVDTIIGGATGVFVPAPGFARFRFVLCENGITRPMALPPTWGGPPETPAPTWALRAVAELAPEHDAEMLRFMISSKLDGLANARVASIHIADNGKLIVFSVLNERD